jgi:nucleoid-associated protein YgaU
VEPTQQKRQSYGQAHRSRPEGSLYAVGFVLIALTLAAFFYVGIDWATGAGRVAGLGAAIAPTPTVAPPPTPSPSPVPSPSPTVAPERTYAVKAGDNPASIAREHGVTLDALLRLNGIDDPTKLQIGQVLRVPPEGSR